MGRWGVSTKRDVISKKITEVAISSISNDSDIGFVCLMQNSKFHQSIVVSAVPAEERSNSENIPLRQDFELRADSREPLFFTGFTFDHGKSVATEDYSAIKKIKENLLGSHEVGIKVGDKQALMRTEGFHKALGQFEATCYAIAHSN